MYGGRRASAAQRWRAARAAASAEWQDLGSDIQSIVRDSAEVSAERLDTLSTQIGERLDRAREQMARRAGPVAERAARGVRECEGFIGDRPWVSVGIAASLGAAAGIAIGLLLAAGRR